MEIALGLALSLGDILLKKLLKNPESAPTLAPFAGDIVRIASQAAGESAEETEARIAKHDALVARFAAPPSPEAKV